MQRALDTIELLIASWILGGDDGNRMPASHGILDRALKIAVDQGAFPPWFRDELHFVDSRVGLQCVELPELLDWAQRALLTTAPNPSYHWAQVQVSSKAARQILSDLDIDEGEAREWGRLLREAVVRVQELMSTYPEPAIEEY